MLFQHVFLCDNCYVITFCLRLIDYTKLIRDLALVYKKIVANENTSHLLLRHFHCSIR
jgi:hypothetical protein